MKKVYIVESTTKPVEGYRTYKRSHIVVADNEEDAKNILTGIIPKYMPVRNVIEVDLLDESKTRIIG